MLGYLVSLGADGALSFGDAIDGTPINFTPQGDAITTGSWQWSGVYSPNGVFYNNITDTGRFYLVTENGTDSYYFVPDNFEIDSGTASITLVRDGTIEGTAGDDNLNINYTGDPEDEYISGGQDTIDAGAGNDVVNASGGDDIVFGGIGDDTIFGEGGDDTIFAGDGNDYVQGDSPVVDRAAFKWAGLDDPNGPGAIEDGDELTATTSQTVGGTTVTYTYDATPTGFTDGSGGTDTPASFTNLDEYTAGIDSGGEPIDTRSALWIGGDLASSSAILDFADEVNNVSFRVNDIDSNPGGFTDRVTIRAWDINNNPITVNLTAGSGLTLSNSDGVAGNDQATSNGGASDADDASNSILVSIPGPVGRIEIIYSDLQTTGDDGLVNVTDIYFDAIGADAGNDSISGGAGDDILLGEQGDDIIDGGADNDIIEGGVGADTLTGGTGNDSLRGDGVIVDTSGPNLIQNGNFEDVTGITQTGFGYVGTGGIPGWTSTNPGDDVDIHNDGKGGINGSDGANMLESAGSPTNLDVYQNISGLEPGQEYALTLDAGDADSDGSSQVEVYFGGVLVGVIDPATSGTLESFDFTLIGGSGDGSDQLRLVEVGNDGDNNGMMLDNVQLYPLVGIPDGDDDSIAGEGGSDTLWGDTGNDTLDGGDQADTLYGGIGDDLLDGGEEQSIGDSDTLFGGAGNDTLTETETDAASQDTMFGGSGNDTLSSNSGTDTLYGDADRDTLIVSDGSGSDLIEGGEAGDDYDVLDGSSLTDDATVVMGVPEAGTLVHAGETVTFSEIEEIRTGSGDDTISGSAGTDRLYSGGGDDTINAGAGSDTIVTGDGNDTITISDFDDVDSVDGGAGTDTLILDPADDRDFNIDMTALDANGDWGVSDGLAGAQVVKNVENVTTADGDDTITGDNADNIITTNAGNDTIDAGAGSDTVYAGAGEDTVILSSGTDSLDGGAGIDTLDASGGTAPETVVFDTPTSGTAGDTTFENFESFLSGAGDDSYDATLATGALTIDTGTGDDTIISGAGNDTLNAGTGADTVDGGAGNDSIDLGAGGPDGDPDLVVFSDDDGSDTVTNFDAPIDNGDGTFDGIDMLDVSDLTDLNGDPVNTNDVVVSGPAGGPAVLTFPGGESITLVGITPAQLDSPFALEAIGIPLPDGTVSGTAGADLIDSSYLGDPDGDIVDNDDAILPGDSGNDDLIEAGGGDDSILAGDGDDEIYGGTGNDTIDGGVGDDTIFGESGDDTAVVSENFGDDSYTGGETGETTGDRIDATALTLSTTVVFSGNEEGTLTQGANSIDFQEVERIETGSGDDNIFGGTGNDSVNTGAGDDTVFLADDFGDDIFEAGEIDDAGGDVLDGAALTDNVTVTFTGAEAGTISDGTGNTQFSEFEEIATGSGDDTIFGGVGNDSVSTNAGDDTFVVTDGFGNDTVEAGEGGETGGDRLDGANLSGDAVVDFTGAEEGQLSVGSDTVDFTEVEVVATGSGDDTVNTGTGNDTVETNEGDDTFVVTSGFGDDSFTAGEGGETGGDTLDASALTGNVTVTMSGDEAGTLVDGTDSVIFSEVENIFTGSGDDTVIGGAGDENIVTGAGDDVVSGGAGSDTFDTGSGNDTITIADGDSVTSGSGEDEFILEDLGEASNGTINIDGGSESTTAGDVLRLGELADLSTLTSVDDGTGSLTGSVTLKDGTLLNFTDIETIICFTPGTLIATPLGVRDIATLAIGDKVITRDHGIQPIRWIQSRTVPAIDHFAPIRIRTGVMTGQEQDLLVSPQHRMLFQGYRAELLFGETEVLVSAKHLVDGLDVTEESGGMVTYIHMMFDQHEVVYANGAASESFHPGSVGLSAVTDPAREELFALFPDLRSDPNLYGQTARRCLKRHETKLLSM